MTDGAANTFVIIGLGNPGKKYETTRHNLGFLVVERFAQKQKWSFRKSDCCKGLVASGTFFEKTCYLVLPETFMNLSGSAVKAFVKHRDISLKNVLVVCDDFNLNLGQLRLRPKGSAGGHNGLTSIIEELGSEDFARLRVGIGPVRGEVVDFVLEDFDRGELAVLDETIEKSVECCQGWLTEDVERVMGRYNG
ncbi:MAG: aminoacyl-tRNA hydrolase [Candidatus Omnitrophica bacterium]|nr:aminoacyl-tRNA hydrolase [Candidatus Omnitrophota bacterium]